MVADKWPARRATMPSSRSAVLGIGSSLVRERPWTVVLTPLMLAVPLVTLANYFCELNFRARWSRAIWPARAAGCQSAPKPPKARPPAISACMHQPVLIY